MQGSSGSGKSSLLNIVTGINQCSKGKISLLDNDISNWSTAKKDSFRADNIGVIFQQFNLLPYLSIAENVKLPCWISKKRKINVSQKGGQEREAYRMLCQLGIDSQDHHRPISKLSVGQQQRVAAARALIGNPEIIVADEPTSALDYDAREAFMQLLITEVDKQGSTLLFVSHDPTLAHYFDRVIDLPSLNQITT